MENMNPYYTLTGPFPQPGAPVFPGPTPSPFPPSPMMPGPDMRQEPGAQPSDPGEEDHSHEGGAGHSCGKGAASQAHPGDPAAMPGANPAAQPYLHEQFQVGLNSMFPGMGAPPPYVTPQQYAQVPVPAQPGFLGLDVRDENFWKGALLGAGLAILLTNDSVQKGVMKAAAGIFTAAQSGVEELKEKYEDIQAEMKASKQTK